MSNQKKKLKIPKSVNALRVSPAKFAKKHGIKLKGKKLSGKDIRRNKKRVAKLYAEEAIKGLNMAVKILAENASSESNKIEKVKRSVEAIITNPTIMKRIAKLYSREPHTYPHMIYLPSMIMNTLTYYGSDKITEEEKDIASHLDPEALIEFCEKILKKQIKKYRDYGLSKSVSFQMATIIPSSKILKNKFWYKKLIQGLYDIAEKDNVEVGLIIKAISKLEKNVITKKQLIENFHTAFILTRSTNKNYSFNDNQKDLHDLLVEEALVYMDANKESKTRAMLKKYINTRKTAESYKNDGNRVIKFIDHANSNSKYTNLKKVVVELIDDSSSNELYLA